MVKAMALYSVCQMSGLVPQALADMQRASDQDELRDEDGLDRGKAPIAPMHAVGFLDRRLQEHERAEHDEEIEREEEELLRLGLRPFGDGGL